MKLSMSENQLVRTGEIAWQPLNEKNISGIYVKSLRFDSETQRSLTILLKLEPRATYPLHNHPAGEEVFVIDGDIKLGKDELKTGDYLFTAVGNKHRVSTKNGCIILLNAPQEVEIIEKRK